ncbi:MAG TPA: hypothetical protein VIK32_10065, partial [Candidatus Limnocylindrales bacterium]
MRIALLGLVWTRLTVPASRPASVFRTVVEAPPGEVKAFDLGFAVSPDAADLAYVSAEIVAVLHRASAEDDSVCA